MPILVFRWLVAALAAVPLLYGVLGAFGWLDLGVDPGKELTLLLGQAALGLLIATLAMTPAKQLWPWAGWLRVRRQLGLWCFFYASTHIVAFLLFILGLDFSALWTEVLERPYVLVGALAWLALLPLALTSNQRSMRALGKRWKSLHRLIYLILPLGLLHMLWIVRSDLWDWLLFAVPGVLLLLWRLPAKAAVMRAVTGLRTVSKQKVS
ncbi:protein-methionine-sulfoxide reductase heme-binding subunit MsrQ [Atopomonas sediminilitoris]|uniref:protein-methionine-sulfoxide reductase heme-binding subunit MsrQ n=1 Tax=Atopomonas sediminilitoris TaxID=2919919 RepID=UPI001F4DE388|nr:protein-methionine-sulfoxide reductase heme-binding subunit MsrQ [Atopomonas sediminilitoris]MCJ8169930.1 sulfoxide reductase heme-binding subunit YedZ [Atopomonas sediminilitoris]